MADLNAPLEPEPEVGPFIWLIEAYFELSSCKQIGMGVGPIPFTAIVEYARIYRVEDLEEFRYYIRVMDNYTLAKEEEDGKKRNTRSKSLRQGK